MQENQSNSSPDTVSQKHAVSIGALLVDARKHIALSQADVGEQLNLPIRTIQALEENNFEILPESTYVRGYLRNYARAVEINAEGLITAYNEQHHVESKMNARTSSKPSYDLTILWSTAAVLTILVGLLVNWWVDVRQATDVEIELTNNNFVAAATNSKNIAQHTTISTNSVDKTVGLRSNENASLISTSEEAQANNLSSGEMIDADVEQAMVEESLNPNLVSMIPGASVLTVTYVEKSWTEIRDADQNSLMQGLIEPGVVRNLSGKEPFYIFLGNSPGVVIEVNGQYFDHSQYSRSNRTARFEVSTGSLN